VAWQRPPFDPRAVRLWPGGFSRVFGVVSDGVTHTYGLRRLAAAYLVLLDGVVLDAGRYGIDPHSARITLDEIPPAGGWVEILGFGAGPAAPQVPVSRWLEADAAELREKLPVLAPAVAPRFAVDQAVDRVHSTNGSAPGPDGRVYLIPQDEYDILAVDTRERRVERIRVPGLDLFDYGKYAGGFTGPNGRIYGCPDKAGSVLEFDPVSRTGRHIPIEPTYGDHVWTNDMISTAAAVGGTVYGIPFDGDFILTVDGHGERIGQESFGLGSALLGQGKWFGGVHYGDAFYAVPYNHTAILRLRPGGLVDFIPLTTAHPEYAAKYRGGCVVGRKAYFAPFEADHVLEFDLDTHEMAERRWGLDLDGRFKFWGCAHALGHVIFAPFSSRRFLDLDLAADQASFAEYDLPADVFDLYEHAYAGAYADLHGRVHLLAAGARCGLIVDVKRGCALVRRHTGRTQHYLGANTAFRYLDGAGDGEGRIYVNPYNVDDTHWTLDTRSYAVDTLATGAASGRDVFGCRDFGDHYWWLEETGLIRQFRMSGGYNLVPGLLGEPCSPLWIAEPYDRPRFGYGRTKAFFGLYSHAGTGRVYAAPHSQPYFVGWDDRPVYGKNGKTEYGGAGFRDDPELGITAVDLELIKARGAAELRLGLSRDQWCNGAVMGADGNIYGIPYNGTHVIRFNIITNLVELDDYGLDLMGRRKWYGGVRAGNLIYGIPFDHPGVLVIDTLAGTARVEDYGLDLSGRRKFMCGARRGDGVVLVPCDYDRFLHLDPVNGVAARATFGLDQFLDQNLKWGSCGLDAHDNLVCGPLGTAGWTNADFRNPVWIAPSGLAGWSTVKFNGMGSGTFTLKEGWLVFRFKQSFDNRGGGPNGNDSFPRLTPLALPTGATSLVFPKSYNAAAHGWNADCLFTPDGEFVYRMTYNRNIRSSMTTTLTDGQPGFGENVSYYDDFPGVHPWLGVPPAAWAQYDPDERALYPDSELRAYRKEACWNDPIFVGNNTAYAVHCNAGVMARVTILPGGYNIGREYIRDTSNFQRCFWGAVEHRGRLYAVPHSWPVLNSADLADETVRWEKCPHPPGWDFTHLWKDGASFGDWLVFYPYDKKWFGYHNTVTGEWAFPAIPDGLHRVRGWRAWVRAGDYVYGVPYDAGDFLRWDLAARTAQAVEIAQAEDVDWSDRPWSDAVTFPKSQSHPERDPAFLLPYNDRRVAVAYPWERASGPYLELDHFGVSFPEAEYGTRRWSAWAVPRQAEVPSHIYGVPCDAHGFLVVDVRGEEPRVDDFGLPIVWSQAGKWMSAVELLVRPRRDPGRSFDWDLRPLSLAVPYNATSLPVVDHLSGRVILADYEGYPLNGTRKWWGGSSRIAGVNTADTPTGICYFAPYDAPGVLAVTVEAYLGDDNELHVSARGQLLDFGHPEWMTGSGKWRGAEIVGDRLLMIPYNHNRILTVVPPANPDDGKISAASAVASLEMWGIPSSFLEGTAKFAPNHTTHRRGRDLSTAPWEFTWPAENADWNLRIAYNANAIQAWVEPHLQAADERGWIAVRHPQRPNFGFAPAYDYAHAVPAACGTWLTFSGDRFDWMEMGWRPGRGAKFAAAALDRDGRIVCLPASGFQALLFDPGAGTVRWIRHANSMKRSPGNFAEFAHCAPGGRIFGATKAVTRDLVVYIRDIPAEGGLVWTRFPDAESGGGLVMTYAWQADGDWASTGWRPDRPLLACGDGYVVDYSMEYRDSGAYWSRWHSFDSGVDGADARWQSDGHQSCPTVTVAGERRIHGCLYASPDGMGLMPGNTGNLIVYRRTPGRAGFNRVQVSLVQFERPTSSSHGARHLRQVDTYAVAAGAPGRMWLIPTRAYTCPDLATGRSDPAYFREVEIASGGMTHHRLFLPWYAGVVGVANDPLPNRPLELSVLAAWGYAWIMPAANLDGPAVTNPEPRDIDLRHMRENVLRVNLADFGRELVEIPRIDWFAVRPQYLRGWFPRLFRLREEDGSEVAVALGNVYAFYPEPDVMPPFTVLVLRPDGSHAVREFPANPGLWPDLSAGNPPLAADYDVEAVEALAEDGERIYRAAVAVAAASREDRLAGVRRWRLRALSWNPLADDGASLDLDVWLTVPDVEPYGVPTAWVYREGKLYGAVPPKADSLYLHRAYNNFHCLVADLAAGTAGFLAAPGASSIAARNAFAAGDGKLWFEAVPNERLIRFIRLDPETGLADEPVRTGRHVGYRGGDREHLFNRVYAVDGDRRYYAPFQIRSRSSVLFILDTAASAPDRAPSLGSYGYAMACKDTHKWNGWVYDERRYAYGMPFNNDAILRLDFPDPVNDPGNVTAVQARVDDYSYVESLDREFKYVVKGGGTITRRLRSGSDLHGIMHGVGPAENFARGGAMTRYGTIFAAPYAPRNGQTLEIRPDGRSRIRRFGPDYVYPRKWADLVEGPDGRLYGAPYDSPEVFCLDPAVDLAGSSHANLDPLEGEAKYAVAASGPDKVYMLPYSADDILVVDPAAETMHKLRPEGVDLAGERKWRGHAQVGDWVYCAPFDSDRVLKFNVVTEEIRLLPVPDRDAGGNDAQQPGKWRCLVRGGDGVLYAAPFNAPDFLAVDPASDAVTRFDPELGFPGLGKWASAILLRDGRTILAAGGSSHALLELVLGDDGRISGRTVSGDEDAAPSASRYSALAEFTVPDGEGGSASRVVVGPATTRLPAIVEGGEVADGSYDSADPLGPMPDRWLGGAASGDALVLVPHNHGLAGLVSPAGVLSFLRPALEVAGTDKWSDVTVVGGRAYCVPYDHDRWLSYDVDNFLAGETRFGEEIPGDGRRWSAGVAVGGVIHAVPFDAPLIARVDAGADSVVHDRMGLPAEVLAGEGKWSDAAQYSGGGNAFFIPFNSDRLVEVYASDGSAAAVRPRLAFAAAGAAFGGGARLGGGQLWANYANDLPCVVSPDGLARTDYFGIALSETSAACRFGGALALDGGSALLLPGGSNLAVVLAEGDGGGSWAAGLTTRKIAVPYSGGLSASQPRTVGGAVRDGLAYLVPHTSRTVARLDPAAGTAAVLATPSLPGGQLFAGAVLDPGGDILGIPFNASALLRIGLDDAVTAWQPPGIDLSGPAKWWGGVTVGGRHFLIPHSADKVLVIAADGTVALTDYGLDLSGEGKWKGAVVRGDYIYAVPHRRSEWLIIDAANDSASLEPPEAIQTGEDRIGGFVDLGDAVVLLPGLHSVAQLASPSDWFPGVFAAPGAKPYPADWTGREKFATAFALADGDLVLVPARERYFMVYSPARGTVTVRRYGLEQNNDSYKYSGAAAPGTDYVFLAGREANRVRIRLSAGSTTDLTSVPPGDLGAAASGTTAYVLTAAGTRLAYTGPNVNPVSTVLTGEGGYVPDAAGFTRLRAYGGRLYSAPRNSMYLFANPTNSALAYRPPSLGLESPAKWRGAVAGAAGHVYALPYDLDAVFHYDGRAMWAAWPEGIPAGAARWLGGVRLGGKLYGTPYDAESVGVYDPATGLFATETYGADLAGKGKWGAAAVRGEEIIFLPAGADHALIVNPARGTSRTVPFPYQPADRPGWLAWVDSGTLIYGIPFSGSDLAAFDPERDEFTLRRVEPDLAGEELYACGAATSGGGIIYPPHFADRSLELDPVGRRVRPVDGGFPARLRDLRPVAAVVHWVNDPELLAEWFNPATDLEEEGAGEGLPGATPPDQPPADLEEDWFIISGVSGASRYDRDSGAVLVKNPPSWSVNPLRPTEQFAGFAYASRSGKVYGAPFDATKFLTIVRRASSLGCSLDAGVPNLETRGGCHAREVGTVQNPETIHWDVLGDNFGGAARNIRLDPVFIAASGVCNLRLDAFTGICHPENLETVMEALRPHEEFVFSGNMAIGPHDVLDNLTSRFAGATLGPDGLLYLVPAGARWGLVSGYDGLLDRVYAPALAVPRVSAYAERLEFDWRPLVFSSSCLDADGNIVWAPGTPVTAGRINNSLSGFASLTWFDMMGEQAVDAFGHSSRRRLHRIFFVNTGVWAVADSMHVYSRILNYG
jgi:hypothetical protein